MPSESSAVSEILRSPKFGKGVGFRRMRSVLKELFDSTWGSKFTTIRVTGSNGKGSVTAMMHSILRAFGIRAGRFTSPHLYDFRERIVIDDTAISDDALERAYAWVKGEVSRTLAAHPDEKFGSFELMTATCLRSFFEADLPVGVIEAGIGGRFDPTRLLPGRLIALTSLDLEHTELLGNSLEQIGYDKIDLCPDHGCVVAPRFAEDLWSRLSAYCAVCDVQLIDAREHCRVRSHGIHLDRARPEVDVEIRTERISCAASIPLIGAHQLENLAVAVSLIDVWTQASLSDVSPSNLSASVAAGLARVDWPGRFERISTSPPVFIDVGHSPGACRRLVETARSSLAGAPLLLVTGVSANKAVEEILEILTPLASAVICTRAYHHGEAVDRIAAVVKSLAGDRPQWIAPTIEEAARLSREIATARQMTVLVAGGLFLAAEFAVAWKGQNPHALTFL